MYEDLDPVRSWTGQVLVANFKAVMLNFNYAGEPAQAIALTSVCYDDDGGEVRNLYTCPSYAPGNRVYFDAVYSTQSDLPDIWKVGMAWTDRKPRELDTYDVDENDYEIVKLYTGCYIHSSLLYGDSDIPDKDLTLETEAIDFFVTELKQLIMRGIIYNMEEDDLDELLGNADDNVVDYIKDCYSSVLDFFEFHRTIFKVTRSNMIFPCRYAKLQNYFDHSLPDMLDDGYEDWGENSSEYD